MPHPLSSPQTERNLTDAPPRETVLALFSAVMLPMFLATIDQTLLATASPRIGAQFGDLGDTSWIAIGYLLAATVMAPVYGRLGDRLGRRNVLIGALGVFALGSLACGTAPSMAVLIGSRVLQGLGGGGLMVLCQALIGEIVPPRHRPRYQAYFAIVFTASGVGGPVIGGLVVHHADWRWLFLANLPLCAFAAWRVSRLPSHAPATLRGAPTDPAGLLLFVSCAVAALLWFNLAGRHFHWLSWPSAGLLVWTIGSGAVLVAQQRRHTAPFLPLDLLRQRTVQWICATVACFAAGMFALIFLLPIQLQLVHGASAAGAGWQMLPLTLGLVLGSMINSRIVQRTSVPTRNPPFGLGLSAIGLAVLALAPPTTAVIVVAAAFVGLGFGTVMPNAQLATQTIAGPVRLGAAAALLSLTRSLGASLGTAAFGGLAFVLLQVGPGETAAAQQPASHPPAQAFHIVYGVLAAFVAIGAWAASRVPPVHLDADAAPLPAAGE